MYNSDRLNYYISLREMVHSCPAVLVTGEQVNMSYLSVTAEETQSERCGAGLRDTCVCAQVRRKE